MQNRTEAKKDIVHKGFDPKFPWFPNADTFIPRSSILNHVTRSIEHFRGTLLDVGCGYMPYRRYVEKYAPIERYVGMDLGDATTYSTIKPDISWDGITIPLSDNSVQSVLLTEVLEHCPYPEKVLSEIHRVLAPGGKIIFTVPFIWYLHESPFDFYRYTPFAIKKMMKDTRLSILDMYMYGVNSRAFLHSWLIWLKRGTLPKFMRFFIYLCSLPFIFLLTRIRPNRVSRSFNNNIMFTGICGIAYK